MLRSEFSAIPDKQTITALENVIPFFMFKIVCNYKIHTEYIAY